jgi:hypothetical protein
MRGRLDVSSRTPLAERSKPSASCQVAQGPTTRPARFAQAYKEQVRGSPSTPPMERPTAMQTATLADTHAPLRWRLAFTALVALAAAAHLGWEYTQGGIVSHHLLNDPGMPAISNAWGLLLLPLLAWIASARAFHRPGLRWRPRPAFVLRLAGAMLAGIALSTAFASGAEELAGGLFLAIILAGIVLRAYRAEFVLGFALGMMPVIGGVLPVLVGGCIALLSALAWLAVGPLLGRAVAAMRA